MEAFKRLLKRLIRSYSMYVAGGFLFICAYLIGYQMAYRSGDQKVAISVHAGNPSRGLATNQGKRDIATVSSPEYSNLQNVFQKAQIITRGDTLQFVLGNIISQDEKGNKAFICQSFSEVDFLFEAEGLFIEGEKVIMQMTANCMEHSDHKWLGLFSIPSQEILNAPITRTQFESDTYKIKFSNVSLAWPKSWILREVYFKNSNTPPLRVIADLPQTEEDHFFSIQLESTN